MGEESPRALFAAAATRGDFHLETNSTDHINNKTVMIADIDSCKTGMECLCLNMLNMRHFCWLVRDGRLIDLFSNPSQPWHGLGGTNDGD